MPLRHKTQGSLPDICSASKPWPRYQFLGFAHVDSKSCVFHVSLPEHQLLMVARFSEPKLSFFECSHNFPWRQILQPALANLPNPRLLAEVASEHAPWLGLPAPSETIFFVITIMLSLRSEVFTRPPIPPVTLTWLYGGRQDCQRSLLTGAMCSTTDAQQFCALPLDQQHRHHTYSM